MRTGLAGALRSLDRPQIGGERAGIVAAKAESWHVRVAAGQPRLQPPDKPVEIDAAVKSTEGGGAAVRARSASADGMAPGAQSFGQRASVALQGAELEFRGEAGGQARRNER